MYYLEKKQLQPQLILLSVFFLPIILAIVVTFCINQSKTALIVLSILLFVYVVLIAVLGILSLRKNKYLEVKGDMLSVRYPNINCCKNCLKITNTQIISIGYYKLSSVKNWLMLFNYVLPKSVYIVYMDENDKQCCDFIGYLNINDVRKISKQLNVSLNIH